MPPKTFKKGKTAEVGSSPSRELATGGLLAPSKTSALDPALRQVIQEVTENITVLIKEKLDPLTQMLQAIALELKDLAKRTTQTEDRIAVQSRPRHKSERIQALEKQTESMTRHINDLERRTYMLSVCPKVQRALNQ